ncbi:MAG: SprB repeat-containing protein [Ferruginibacter sp.]
MRKSLLFAFFVMFLMGYISCSKSGPSKPADPCAGITITVSGTTVNATAGISNGSITAIGSGSTGLTYTINGGSSQSSGTFISLAPGTYTITAKNASGCSGSSQFTVGSVNPCNGVNVTVTGTVVNAGAANNNGSITATATGGTTFTYSINGAAFQSSGVFSALPAGSYIITARNENGCTGTATFAVTNPCSGVTVAVSATVTNTNSGASTGSITATASGGSGFTFSLNSSPFQASGTFINLAAGNYTVVAKNSNGCTGSGSFIVNTTNPCTGVTITATSAIVNVTPCSSAANGSITLTASGGTGPYTFSLNAGTFQSSNTFSGLAAGSYSAGIKDANGCTGSLNNITVATAGAGPLFTDVKQLLAANCAISGCHAGPTPQNGLDFSLDCTIVGNSARIKARAVDANPSQMPPPPNAVLSTTDKQKIVNWINAGGQVNN